MRGIWLPNLKKWLDGEVIGGFSTMRVSVVNTVAVPVSATFTTLVHKERRFHLPATTNIPARASAMVQLDLNSNAAGSTPSDVANTITELAINWNGGEAIEVGAGADATAAAANIIASCGAGQTRAFGCSLSSGNKIWVRAVKNTAITDGELMITLLG